MSTELQPPLHRLTELADWVRAHDEHAAQRLVLLARVQQILAGKEEARADQRLDLAERLERWRYRHLDHLGGLGGSVAAEDRRLVDALDLAANDLARRDPRPPRWPRAAIEDTSCGDGPSRRAADCLDPGVSLEDLSRRAAEVTREHFAVPGTDRRRMLLYAPLYLSSHCTNHCVYCGFRYPQEIERKHLAADEALGQAEILRGRGFRHILLVAGDFPRLTTTEYFAELIRLLAARQISTAVEIAPQTTASYAELSAAGACGVTLYQETYNRELYALYHPRGSKASFDWRLEGLERAAEVGLQRLGLGILLGLAEPREDLLALVRHAAYLQARFPGRTLALSLPRIHQAPPGFKTPFPVDEQTFVRSYCALRMAFPRAELVLSTREAVRLRSRLAEICITQMSAGSSTVPGGYGNGRQQAYGEQFPVCDDRSPDEVARWLRDAEFEPAWEV